MPKPELINSANQFNAFSFKEYHKTNVGGSNYAFPEGPNRNPHAKQLSMSKVLDRIYKSAHNDSTVVIKTNGKNLGNTFDHRGSFRSLFTLQSSYIEATEAFIEECMKMQGLDRLHFDAHGNRERLSNVADMFRADARSFFKDVLQENKPLTVRKLKAFCNNAEIRNKYGFQAKELCCEKINMELDKISLCENKEMPSNLIVSSIREKVEELAKEEKSPGMAYMANEGKEILFAMKMVFERNPRLIDSLKSMLSLLDTLHNSPATASKAYYLKCDILRELKDVLRPQRDDNYNTVFLAAFRSSQIRKGLEKVIDEATKTITKKILPVSSSITADDYNVKMEYIDSECKRILDECERIIDDFEGDNPHIGSQNCRLSEKALAKYERTVKRKETIKALYALLHPDKPDVKSIEKARDKVCSAIMNGFPDKSNIDGIAKNMLAQTINTIKGTRDSSDIRKLLLQTLNTKMKIFGADNSDLKYLKQTINILVAQYDALCRQKEVLEGIIKANDEMEKEYDKSDVFALAEIALKKNSGMIEEFLKSLGNAAYSCDCNYITLTEKLEKITNDKDINIDAIGDIININEINDQMDELGFSNASPDPEEVLETIDDYNDDESDVEFEDALSQAEIEGKAEIEENNSDENANVENQADETNESAGIIGTLAGYAAGGIKNTTSAITGAIGSAWNWFSSRS